MNVVAVAIIIAVAAVVASVTVVPRNLYSDGITAVASRPPLHHFYCFLLILIFSTVFFFFFRLFHGKFELRLVLRHVLLSCLLGLLGLGSLAL
jgi:hypothetical protein